VTEHGVVIAGAGPTGLMLAGDRFLAEGKKARVGDLAQLGLADALTRWFGPPAEGSPYSPSLR